MYTEGSIRQKCWKFYQDYKGEKVSFNTLYQKAKTRKGEPLEELIKPTPRVFKPRHNGVFSKELYWYEEQPEPKATREQFNNRLHMGFPKEQAILTWEPRDDLLIMRELQRKRVGATPPSSNRLSSHSRMKEDDDFEPDYYRIDITYSKEEAEVFRNEYLNLIWRVKKEIEDIEQVLLITEERIEKIEWELAKVKLLNELDLLEAQLNIFNSYNK